MDEPAQFFTDSKKGAHQSGCENQKQKVWSLWKQQVERKCADAIQIHYAESAQVTYPITYWELPKEDPLAFFMIGKGSQDHSIQKPFLLTTTVRDQNKMNFKILLPGR